MAMVRALVCCSSFSGKGNVVTFSYYRSNHSERLRFGRQGMTVREVNVAFETFLSFSYFTFHNFFVVSVTLPVLWPLETFI